MKGQFNPKAVTTHRLSTAALYKHLLLFHVLICGISDTLCIFLSIFPFLLIDFSSPFFPVSLWSWSHFSFFKHLYKIFNLYLCTYYIISITCFSLWITFLVSKLPWKGRNFKLNNVLFFLNAFWLFWCILFSIFLIF